MDWSGSRHNSVQGSSDKIMNIKFHEVFRKFMNNQANIVSILQKVTTTRSQFFLVSFGLHVSKSETS